MKRAISIILTAIMLCACLAVSVYADEEPVNYALTATYTAESSVGENIYGLVQGDNGPNPGAPRGNDSEHKRLNDGYTGYDECTGIDNAYFNGEAVDENKVIVHTEDTSVCYTGTGSEITLEWDLGSIKNDIAKIGFLNTRSQFEWAEDNQFEDFMDGIYDAYSRSFPLDNINLWIAGDDHKYTRLKQKDSWTYDVIGLDNPYTDVVESELKDCPQRNVFMVFNQSLAARYIKISLSPKRYVLSLDEIQILGGGEPVDVPTTPAPEATTTAAAATDAAITTAAPEASTTAAATDAPATTTKAAATNAPAASTTKAAAPTTTPTTAAQSSDNGGSNVGLIIGIIAAVIVVAAIVVVVIKKKK